MPKVRGGSCYHAAYHGTGRLSTGMRWTVPGQAHKVPAMSFRLPTRRLIALAAAYLVAAQAIVLPLSVAVASPFVHAQCASASGGAGHGPAGTDGGCGCAAGCGMQCCAPAHLTTPPAEFRLPLTVARVLAPLTVFYPGVRADSRGSHRSRAPPVA